MGPKQRESFYIRTFKPVLDTVRTHCKESHVVKPIRIKWKKVTFFTKDNERTADIINVLLGTYIFMVISVTRDQNI